VSRGRAIYLAPERLDPPTSGGRRRGASLLAGLRGYLDVVLLTPEDVDSAFPSWTAAVERMKNRRGSQVRRAVDAAGAMASGKHILLQRGERAGLPEALADVVEVTRPGLVVLGRPYFGSFIDAARSGGAVVVADADETLVRVARSVAASDAALSKRLRALFNMGIVGRMERRDYPRFEQVWAGSQIERGYFIRYVAPDRVIEVPNVVSFASTESSEPPPTPTNAGSDVTAVAYVGWYGYPPNEAAALELAGEIMPRVRALGGPGKLILIGRDPTPRMERLALGGEVEVTGEVDDVVPLLRRAGLLAVPLRSGGGTRVKIIEAAAVGVPVVSTRFGIEGLGLDSGECVLIADKREDFARAIVRLAADAELRSKLTARARAVLVQGHSPAVLSEILGRALAGLGLA
jgi:hypothetical protein